MATMFELQEQIADLDRTIATERRNGINMASDAGAKMEDIRACQQRVSDLVERRAILQKECDRVAAESRARAAREGGQGGAEMTFEQATGMYLRHLATGGKSEITSMAYEQLGAIPAGSEDQGNGSALLPKKLSERLLLQPQKVNPLRSRMGVTNVTGLSLPKLAFTIDDDSYAAKDGETAKELKGAAETVDFGRHKMHLMCKVSTTLLRSSPLDIQGAVLRGLDSAMTLRELRSIFATAPVSGEEGMSLYAKKSSSYIIKQMEAESLLGAIVAAAGDLEDIYQDNASIAMRRQDYYALMMALANGSESLFSGKPAQILGYPVDFVDKATVPVVGDFSYLHINYDCAPFMDMGKSVETGVTIFTEDCVYDIKRLMDAAFRLATVKPTGAGG